MKKALLLVLFALTFGTANAQFKVLAEGPAFKEPEEGFAKIIQLKNGGTMFLRITVKEGIDVRMYDAGHQETSVNTIKPAYGKLKNGHIEAVFEIGGDGVLMISEIESRTPMLYRLVIDGKNGTLKEETKIAELSKISFGAGYAVVFGGVPMPDFYVRKDPYSDNYAVVMFNSFESERSKRIEIVTYGSKNQEVSRAYYASPEEKYKYLQYVDMAVIGSDKVCVMAYGYNTRSSGGKESELILANLDKGAKAVTFTELGFSKDLKVYSGITRYNPVTKSLILIATTKGQEKEKGYTPIMAFVNPYDSKINRVDVISPSERINQFSKGGFTGLPQNLFVNEDGTFTVVSEEMTIIMSNNTVRTELGDMAIVNYSKTGEFSDDHIIRKSHVLSQTYLSTFYHSHRDGTAQELKGGNQYKSFAYINGNSKSYILFNDTERNNDKQEKGGLVSVQGVGGSDGFYYLIKGLDVVPARFYIFGDSEKKRDHELALFSISDYDKQRNIYTTLKLEKGSKKGVQLVWLQP
jgi:hypothetical protein